MARPDRYDTPERRAEASRIAQGLPRKITDPAALARGARILLRAGPLKRPAVQARGRPT
jgi:hypothetical protein